MTTPLEKADTHNQPVEPDAQAPSGVVRHLGMIKALAVIMAVLIVAALVTIVVTIYSRLQTRDAVREATNIDLVIPADATVVSASGGDAKGGLTLVIQTSDGQQIWRLSATGRVLQKMTVKPE